MVSFLSGRIRFRFLVRMLATLPEAFLGFAQSPGGWRIIFLSRTWPLTSNGLSACHSWSSVETVLLNNVGINENSCRIWGSHSSGSGEFCLIENNAVPQDRWLQWKPPSHFILYNVSKVTDYKLNGWSSIRYIKGHHILRCDSFTWVKRSVVNLVPRFVMGSGLHQRHSQVFHNVLVTIVVTTLPFRLVVALWNKHEIVWENRARCGIADMDSHPNIS
jgi:hypothetical protein